MTKIMEYVNYMAKRPSLAPKGRAVVNGEYPERLLCGLRAYMGPCC